MTGPMMRVRRTGSTSRTALLMLAGAVPLIFAATAMPPNSRVEVPSDSIPTVSEEVNAPFGQGGPFMPQNVASRRAYLTPKVTLAAHHSGYEMVSAGPLRYPEGALNTGLSWSDEQMNGAALAALEQALTAQLPVDDAFADLFPDLDGHTLSSPTDTKPQREAGSRLLVFNEHFPEGDGAIAASFTPGKGWNRQVAMPADRGQTVEVLFENDGNLIDEKAASALRGVAKRVLQKGAHVQIVAFAGDINDRSSRARRMALKRGLAVRAYLLERGVPRTRMSIHPMGGVSDAGPLDRVDLVFSTG